MTKIFIAVTDAEIVRHFHEVTGRMLNVLISFLYLRGQATKLLIDYRKYIKALFLDSSAYTENHNKGEHALLSPYAKYNARFGNKFTKIFTLDDDFSSPEHNYANQHYLEDNMSPNGQRPIPGIHDEKDPFGEIETYVGEGHEYIGIGSNWRHVDKIYQEIKKRFPNLLFHFFGNLNRKMLKDCMPESADSAAYAHQAANGIVSYWDAKEEVERLIHFGKYEQTPKGKKMIHYKICSENEYGFEEFLDKTFGYSFAKLLNDPIARQIVNIYFFTQLEDQINASDED